MLKNKEIIYFLLLLLLLCGIGLLSYAKHPKTTDLVCKDFNGFRKTESTGEVVWHIDTLRISLTNNVFTFNQFDKNMAASLFDSTASASIFRVNDLKDATLDTNKMLSVFVPTPHSYVGMMQIEVDMVTGDAHISTWHHLGGEGNGVLKGNCQIKEFDIFDKVKVGFIELL